MAGSVEELITMLYEMVQDAWGVPLSNEKCVIERDKALDLLDEISAQLPNDLKQARGIVENRQEIITSAKKEAEAIRRVAEDRARQLVAKEEIFSIAKRRASDMIMSSEAKAKEIRRASYDFVDDSIKRTEENLAQVLLELRQTRAKFKSSSTAQPSLVQSSPTISETK